MQSILDTGIANVKNPSRYIFGEGTVSKIRSLLDERKFDNSSALIFIDHYFRNKQEFIAKLNLNKDEVAIFVSTEQEPTTDYVDELLVKARKLNLKISTIVGIGGGSTLDIAKAVSNLLTNDGHASDYQGWDLVKKPGIYKIGIPTLSGTGSESTRTCVMTNKTNNLKLGMNSDHTIFDQLILDPNLTKTVPRDQYFYSGMDSYIHCIESLNGSYRNSVGDAYSNQVKQLCQSIFLSQDMQSQENRSKLMVASYLGGCAIATSYVGLIHPFSAGLSVVLGLHHCIANCLAFKALSEFYKDEYREFNEMCIKQKIELPSNMCKSLKEEEFLMLYESTIIHEKPLTNALGPDFKKILTKDKVREIFERI
tara:strand:- start:1280 stop:2380 length:1101 start_codon:yes stop_codon:yes gene_type:complete